MANHSMLMGVGEGAGQRDRTDVDIGTLSLRIPHLVFSISAGWDEEVA